MKSQTTEGGSSLKPEVVAAINQSEEWAKTPVAYLAAGGPADSVIDCLASIGGFFNPANWNAAGMERLYQQGPLGQAESLTNSSGDFLDRNASRMTAGSLGVSAAATAGLLALEAGGATATNGIGRAAMRWQGGELTFTRPLTGSKDLRINPLGDWRNPNG